MVEFPAGMRFQGPNVTATLLAPAPATRGVGSAEELGCRRVQGPAVLIYEGSLHLPLFLAPTKQPACSRHPRCCCPKSEPQRHLFIWGVAMV